MTSKLEYLINSIPEATPSARTVHTFATILVRMTGLNRGDCEAVVMDATRGAKTYAVNHINALINR